MSQFNWIKEHVTVFGYRMAYHVRGTGDPVVFLHGNPTSSFLWRNILPSVSTLGRCIAVDLIGMGDSEKLKDSSRNRYSFCEHYRFLREFLYQLDATKNVVMVVHDWGSALGFHWAHQHPDAVKGLCYMEAIVKSLHWNDFPEAARGVFQGFRSPAGESMVLERNIFVERVLPGSILRELNDEEMAEYRRPFNDMGEARRPTLTWPREIPIDGEPDNVVKIADEYGHWLKQSNIPKLFINAEPGAILTGLQRDFCRTWLNQTEVTVKGSHFIQEDSASEISDSLNSWLKNL